MHTVIELRSLFWEDPQIIRAGDWKECWLHCSQQTTFALVPSCTPYRNGFTIQPFNNHQTWLAIQDLYIFRELWMTHAITHLSFFGYGVSGSNTDVRWIQIFTCKWVSDIFCLWLHTAESCFPYFQIFFSFLNGSPTQFSVPVLYIWLANKQLTFIQS